MAISKIIKNALMSYITVLFILALLPAYLVTNDISLISGIIESMNTR
ncbi:hypothetical protein GFC29_183 [Anoxybacillus sp. B7M1]|jgi:hypothetical protein|uniref:Uncharacterized protein n=1 Tax=Anoxybacteroides rupiense TaxID=311460 RepID=A0ABD5IYM7_9BACL|nr:MULTISPECIES: hypothetical protein [Anoxybacillus]ANB58694.1 hypothetical protein GFC28_1445 [Anoxybacillus sp. B2M1]ANB63287.1 hypothetical protein GFC29_183 [Anoxybacillus sp. B7M1]KXG10341.1 hypothetical protein AT864_00932 [Anoxybacillus sp. P3H1B]MBB3906375.1 hypothetical protein [Anoxybacillus rupiensis]MBS2770641.1 hypothetical protein [Anoxybacillus rupiensis]